jgi:chorismate mutase
VIFSGVIYTFDISVNLFCNRRIATEESGIQPLLIGSIREALIEQEDTLIYSLLQRAQYCYNAPTYDKNCFAIPGFEGSLIEYMLQETEHLHAKVRRYSAPDEHPFFPIGLPEPILPPLQQIKVLHPAADSININKDIWSMYYNDLLPKIVAPGDDGNYGSASVCDVLCLQVFHYTQILLVCYSGYVHHKRM